MAEQIIIDANGGIMGRIATFAAKQLLLGKKIAVVNCENALISGKKYAVVNTYKQKLSRGGTAQKGPYISRTPAGIFRRAVRGMLPWDTARGKEAFKRLRCYAGIPNDLNGEKLSFKEEFYKPHITIKELLKLV